MSKNITEQPKRGRILTLDILRGYFLAVIAIDHFRQFPSMLDAFTGRGMLWVSAAEGFFIISGLVVGYIYGPKMLTEPKKTTKRIWKRALLLYGLTVGFTLAFTVWGRLMIGHEGLKEGLISNMSAWQTIFYALKLQYVYGWIDFLALYAVFMAVAPLAIYLIVKRKGWLVLLASFTAWFLLRGVDIRFGWQIFFMPAMVIGYYLPTLEAKLNSFTNKTKKIIYTTSTLVVLLMLSISVYFVFIVPFIASRPEIMAVLPSAANNIINNSIRLYHTTIEPNFYKWTMPLPRVAFAWLWFMTLYLLVRHFEAYVLRYTKDFFTALGRNSLFIYCTMGVFIFGLHFIIVPRVTRFNTKGLLVNTLINAIFLAILYIAVKYREKYFKTAKPQTKPINKLQ